MGGPSPSTRYLRRDPLPSTTPVVPPAVACIVMDPFRVGAGERYGPSTSGSRRARLLCDEDGPRGDRRALHLRRVLLPRPRAAEPPARRPWARPPGARVRLAGAP